MRKTFFTKLQLLLGDKQILISSLPRFNSSEIKELFYFSILHLSSLNTFLCLHAWAKLRYIFRFENYLQQKTQTFLLHLQVVLEILKKLITSLKIMPCSS